MDDRNETDLSEHFSFGENWHNFSHLVTDDHLNSAKENLIRLLGASDLKGKTFCDVRCGSGIHSIAAALLGATVTSIDIDPISTSTTSEMAKKFGVEKSVKVVTASVLEDQLPLKEFDIVYSWGVLHHTGDMWNAINRSIELLSNKQGSIFAIALYRRTLLCNFWKIEKRIYKNAPQIYQRFLCHIMALLMDCSLLLRLRSPKKFKQDYQIKRGMSREHDIHDWLGGYPYESVEDRTLRSFFESKDFALQKSFVKSPNRKTVGLFGSGCDEYLFVRN